MPLEDLSHGRLDGALPLATQMAIAFGKSKSEAKSSLPHPNFS
jgi:hypothetical protein